MDNPDACMKVLRRSMLLIVCLVGFVGCVPEAKETVAEESKPALKLTIISPHSERIRQSFAEAFSDWYQAKHDRTVRIDWIVRGTPQCVEYIEDLFAGRDSGGALPVPDLMFGGGINYHAALAERGRCFAMELGDAVAGIPGEVNGLPTRDAQNQWVATGLSSFGILYNAADCKARGIAAPKTWSDLASPQYAGWLAIANPNSSGSARQCMMLILQQEGWNQGWGTLMRILANARALDSSSTRAHDQIESGVMLAGFAVNFDGLRRAKDFPGKLAYINPEDGTAVTPDLVSIIKTASDSSLAQEFVRFCLSDEGQATWSVAGQGRDGADRTLYHYPIKPETYKANAGKMAVEDNPFERDFGIRVDRELAAEQSSALVPLTQAVVEENHILLQQVWAAIQAADMNEEALSVLCTPIVEEEEAFRVARQMDEADAEKIGEIRRTWSAAVRKKLEQAMALVQG